ncbi:hypothetical protein Pcac1_g1196 [Phytophthora cactorum]|uniref:Uncharacterized protein n=1 Tax=Phytophthora cactorum TaxID=29920 RepID=A0A8T1C501_9STRA|nr:hypothetical protein Pcac1_g1196 [Phytophthora cactorum]KAG2886610.1 hypothetical protein PC114_g19185 [Phytophthora cactorum]KAG2915086.1 hypothetical protein PC117_g18120 [Phytophthora cactorum]KAG2999952.1 hypothetical protein PC119_g17080 [Phytophthora cactorum]KAG3005160.1 hypothetical protein PC120_g18142 [Phytophthora cactorum]
MLSKTSNANKLPVEPGCQCCCQPDRLMIPSVGRRGVEMILSLVHGD